MPTAIAIADKKYDPHPDFQRLLRVGGRDGVTPSVQPQNFVHFAIGEKSFIKPKTKWFLIEDIDNIGIKKAIDDAINYLFKRVKYIYVAWDIDAMSLTGTGTSGDDQLTLREGLVIARAINKKIRLVGRLVGIEFMEIAPRLERKDLKGQTVNWTNQLVTTCFGEDLFNNFSKMTRNINMHAAD
jgi:arginase family enzyme